MNMDEIKQENFSREASGRSFPAWRALSAEECEKIRSHLASKLGVPQSLQKLALTRLVLEKGSIVEGINARDRGFSLRDVLSARGLNPPRLIYLNWHQFDDIDEMLLSDVSEFFEFLWYPGADDLDLFDESVTWMLSISHDGDIRLASL